MQCIHSEMEETKHSFFPSLLILMSLSQCTAQAQEELRSEDQEGKGGDDLWLWYLKMLLLKWLKYKISYKGTRRGRNVVKALYKDRSLAFCHGKYRVHADLVKRFPWNKCRTYRVRASKMYFVIFWTIALWETCRRCSHACVPCAAQSCIHCKLPENLVFTENQFPRGVFDFSNWIWTWYRISACKLIITKLRDCLADTCAG